MGAKERGLLFRHARAIGEASAAADQLERVRAAVADRCTCEDRDPALGPLEGHEPDCSLQNSGWLS